MITTQSVIFEGSRLSQHGRASASIHACTYTSLPERELDQQKSLHDTAPGSFIALSSTCHVTSRMTSQRNITTCEHDATVRRNVIAPRLHYPKQRVFRTRCNRKIRKLHPACHTLPRIVGNALVSRAYNRFITFYKHLR